MTRSFRLLLLLFIPGLLLTQEHPDSLFQEAQRAYDAEKYSQAISTYQKLLNQNIESASLHYNLGNAYFRQNELGEAILHYEKAKKLNPRDADIDYNLKVAQARIQDRIEPPESSFLMKIFNGIKYWLALRELAWTTGFLFLSGSVIFGSWWLLNQSRLKSILAYALVVWIIGLLLVTPLLISRTMEAAREQYGIVLTAEVSARSGPQNLSTEVFVLHEGTRVEVENTQNQWYKIRLLDGKEGWIQANAVGII